MKQAESEINNLRHENTELNEKLAECECQQKEMSSGLFCVDCFTADRDISFYTDLSSYATFMAIFEYLNPGDNCSNIRPRGSVTDVPEDFYNSDFDDEENVQASKKGRRRKLKPLDIFRCALSPEKRILRKTFGSSLWCGSVYPESNFGTMDKLHVLKIWP